MMMRHLHEVQGLLQQGREKTGVLGSPAGCSPSWAASGSVPPVLCPAPHAHLQTDRLPRVRPPAADTFSRGETRPCPPPHRREGAEILPGVCCTGRPALPGGFRAGSRRLRHPETKDGQKRWLPELFFYLWLCTSLFTSSVICAVFSCKGSSFDDVM